MVAAMKILHKAVDELVEWGKEYGLKFNPDKTGAVIFHRRKLEQNQIPEPLKTGGKQISLMSAQQSSAKPTP